MNKELTREDIIREYNRTHEPEDHKWQFPTGTWFQRRRAEVMKGNDEKAQV